MANSNKREKRARALMAGTTNKLEEVPFRGCTIWLTGLPHAGKTTLANAVEDFLLSHDIAAYCLDEHCFPSENIQCAAETAKLLADSGQVCVASFASPKEGDRALAKQIHDQAGLHYFEVFINTSADVIQSRANENKKDLSYEIPQKPDLIVSMVEGTDVYENIQCVIELLVKSDILPRSLLDTIPELFVPEEKLQAVLKGAETLPLLEITQTHLQWLQVLAEGWAVPLRGFMNEKQYLQCLHFGTITDEKWGTVSNMTIPITLSLSHEEKERLEKANEKAIALSYTAPNTTKSKLVAILRNPEFYEHRKEERCCRVFGTSNPGHPGVQTIWNAGDWLVGGDVDVLGRITWNDDLDGFRLSPNELRKKFRECGADAIFVHQSRHPLHNGHALLFADTQQQLVKTGFKKPFLHLQILAGFSKLDDISLSVRMRQYEVVLEANLDGLRRDQTVMSIFPAPLIYAGPREIQWHCRTRLVAGASFYIVGRDPAGVPHPTYKGQAMYEPSHGAKTLAMAPGLEHMEILPLRIAVYDRAERKMVLYDDHSHGDFDFIDGAKLKALIRSGTEPPPGFMEHKAWRVLAKYS